VQSPLTLGETPRTTDLLGRHSIERERDGYLALAHATSDTVRAVSARPEYCTEGAINVPRRHKWLSVADPAGRHREADPRPAG
jgi:hypothetical protein